METQSKCKISTGEETCKMVRACAARGVGIHANGGYQKRKVWQKKCTVECSWYRRTGIAR